MLISDLSYRIEAKKFVVGPLGTNCYVIRETGSEKGILIDPGECSREIAAFIEKENINILYTLNTHGHADHIAGNAAFGYPVIIHELDAPYLTAPVTNRPFFIDLNIPPIVPARLLKDGDTIKLEETDLEVIHTPGHTPGGICVRYSDIVFSGDTLFFEGVGRTDFPGGNQDHLMKSIHEKLFTLPVHTRVFPGHGEETTIGHEIEHNPYI